jgi:hypothetical protein
VVASATGARKASLSQSREKSSSPDAAVDPRGLQLGRERLGTGKFDAEEGRALADPRRSEPLRLDADRSCNHVWVARPQQSQVIDPVQERDHDRAAHALGRRERQGRLELHCLCRHPERVDVAVETRRCGDFHLEIAQDGALDGKPAAVTRKGLRSHEQDDAGTDPCQRPAEKTTDAARAEDCVSHLQIVAGRVVSQCARR